MMNTNVLSRETETRASTPALQHSVRSVEDEDSDSTELAEVLPAIALASAGRRGRERSLKGSQREPLNSFFAACYLLAGAAERELSAADSARLTYREIARRLMIRLY
jgi:hypothetical protein